MGIGTTIMAHRGPRAVVLHLLLQIHLAAAVACSLLPSLAGASLTTTSNHTAAAVQAPCLHHQETALMRLKRSFTATNNSITAFRSWSVSIDCCSWVGVHCGNADGSVTSLDLGNWGLESAGLDSALFDLTSLRYLNLAGNDFNMTEIPSVGFEKLTELTSLNLSNANFAGQVPHNIGQLTNLLSLDLSTYVDIEDITGLGYIVDADHLGQLTMPNFTSLVANLSNLRELHLGSVDLSQSSAKWCDALSMYTPNLRVLRLPFCNPSSRMICGTLSTLHSLSVIDLQYNHLTGLVSDLLPNNSFLNVLQLSYNKLEGWVSPGIFQHKELVTIDLHHNPKVSGSLPNISADSCLQNLLVGKTNFSGTIPSSIGKIKSLKRLGLDAPGFSGDLPSSIGELKSLSIFKLSGLNLVGPIPSWITNLTSLEVLQFSKCGLYGQIPSSIGHLIKLKTFAVMGCKASGRIPPHILNMTQLEELVLSSNNFTGLVELNSFWRLPNLFNLDMSNNMIVVTEGQYNSSMVSFPDIIYLRLASCSITKFPSIILKHLNNINGIDLSNNQMHGAIPRWAWEKWSHGPTSGLFFLNFSHNKFTSVGYDTFLPIFLVKLDLSFNMFEGPIPLPRYSGEVLDYSSNNFSSMPHNFSTQLKSTYIFKASRNKLSGNIPTSFCMGLEFLDLSYNTFNGSVPTCLMEDAQRLRVLNLRKNQLDRELPRNNINESCSLWLLDISGNRMEGQLPRSLVACKSLEILNVANNNITDSFPCWMSSLPRLQVLILKDNKFFGSVTPYSAKEKATCGLPSVRILDLSYNNFSGILKSELLSNLIGMMGKVNNETLVMEYEGYQEQPYQATAELIYKGLELEFDKILRTLGFLDVSSNAFGGSVPAAIGELVLLDVLNMSHNSFTGTIPSQLGHLTYLESLDLSSNELSGEIPMEIAWLDSLTTLNLSNNKLVGSIPESTHFTTFSNNSFLGNDGLCGPPLSKECINTTIPNMVPHHPKKKYVDVVLFLFAGLGFGVGFAIAIVGACRSRIPSRKWC